MLRHLSLRDFAVVKQAEMAFPGGMVVVSGETGAGKSLLVDALLLLGGARADASVVRTGAERAEILAEFSLDDCADALAWLREQALDEDTQCQLRRVIRADGGSRAWINGRSATAGQLQALSAMLFEVHGQHEHQALLDRGAQLALLDGFQVPAAIRAEVRSRAEAWRALQREIAQAGTADDVDDRLAWLSHQLAELAPEDLGADSIDALQRTQRRMANGEALRSAAVRASQSVGDDGALTGIQQAVHALARWQADEPRFAAVIELLESSRVQITEALSTLDSLLDEGGDDPEEQRRVESRLSRLHELARKHRVTLAGLAEREIALRDEQERLLAQSARQASLAPALAAARLDWEVAAKHLSQARETAANRLGDAVTALMQDLGMAGGRFAVRLEPAAGDPASTGAERVEFEVAANPGQSARPLRKVASGGELARIALAIEVAALGGDPTPTMVFDEVDAGIGGAVAEIVGRLLRALGRDRQVLCVTHLPQVAAQGHGQFAVRKISHGGETFSEPVALSESERLEEIARMLGGLEITAETRAHARQLLARAED